MSKNSRKTAIDLEELYVDAIQDAFLAVQDEDDDAEERLRAQIRALRQCLADCCAFQKELQEESAIDCYGDDLPDEIMPRELLEAAA